ncbi:MAG: methylenetetrahydrofolate reductase [Chitinophagaceae bacterium]
MLNLQYLGIDNVLVLRGDAAKNETAFEPEAGGHKYASDLLKQVVNMNAGIYLEEDLKATNKTTFCIGVCRLPGKTF